MAEILTLKPSQRLELTGNRRYILSVRRKVQQLIKARALPLKVCVVMNDDRSRTLYVKYQ